MPITDYNTNPDLNIQINGINIGEGCLPGNVNNAIRQVMADVRAFYNTSGGGVVVPATESVKGIVELATAAETTAGTDATRAVHPAGLKAAIAAGTAKSAGTADALATARTIALSGLATGTATAFDGGANISIPVTAVSQANKLAAARTIAVSGGATGTATAFDGSANISIPVTELDVGKATAGILAATRGGTGRADGKADGLATARTIAVSGGATGSATAFDGSANISIPVTALDVSKATAGILAATRGGTGRADGKADALATARTIGLSGGATGTATAFDGGANITIPVTGLDVSKATAGVLDATRGGTGRSTGAAPMPVTTEGAVGEWKLVANSKSKITLPAGGTWAWLGFGIISFWGGEDAPTSALGSVNAGISAGGTVLPASGGWGNLNGYALCWRIA